MRKLFIGIAGLVLLGALGAFAGPPVMVIGSEATDGIIYLRSDDGDDATDKWEIHALASGNALRFVNNSVNCLTLSTNGSLTLGTSTGMTFDNSTVGSLILKVGTTATNSVLRVDGAEAGSATLKLWADDGDNAADKADIVMGADDILRVQINTTDVFTVASTGITAPGVSKLFTTPVANANVTNGQVVTLSGVINLLTGISKPNGASVTNTLANPTAAGQHAILFNAAAATNSIAVAKTGNFVGPALSLGAGESAIIYAPSATTWAGIGQ